MSANADRSMTGRAVSLYHVMVEGIEGNSIVADDEDRLFFPDLEDVRVES